MKKIFSIFLFVSCCILGSVYSGLPKEVACKIKHVSPTECHRAEFYYPWGNEQELCKDYTVGASKRSLEPTSLTSFLMSGNSYFLQLIERSSGILTRTLIPSISHWYPRFQVSCGVSLRDGNVLLQGNLDNVYDLYPHWFRKHLTLKGEENLDWPTLSATFFNYRGILLVRNPWIAIIASRYIIREELRGCNNCQMREGGLSETYDFQGSDFNDFVRVGARRWIELLRSWIINSPYGSNLVIVKYEDLIQNPEYQLRRALKFMNVTIDEGRLACTLNDPNNDLPTPARDLGLMEQAFKANEVNSMLERGILEINSLLEKKGVATKLDYETPNWATMLRSQLVTRAAIH